MAQFRSDRCAEVYPSWSNASRRRRRKKKRRRSQVKRPESLPLDPIREATCATHTSRHGSLSFFCVRDQSARVRARPRYATLSSSLSARSADAFLVQHLSAPLRFNIAIVDRSELEKWTPTLIHSFGTFTLELKKGRTRGAWKCSGRVVCSSN